VLAVTVTDELAAATGLPRGALVEQVQEGLGAARAGIQPGDVITRVGDSAVNSVDQMLLAVRTHSPGSAVAVTWTRDGSSHTANVTVAAA
jgi:putative serine protease PepD